MLHLIAQAIPNPVPNISAPSDLVDIFKFPVMNWFAKSEKYGMGIFVALAGPNLAWYFAKMWRHRHELDTAFSAIFFKMVALTFFGFLVTVGGWGPIIIDTFTDYGKDLSGVPDLGPSLILGIGVDLASKLLASSAKTAIILNLVAGLGLLIGALGMILCFAWISFQFAVALIESYIAIAIGPFMLGFAGADWMTDYAQRWFSLIITVGVRLASCYLTIGLGLEITKGWSTIAMTLGAANNGVIASWLIAVSGFMFAGLVAKASNWLAVMLSGSPSMSAHELFGISSAVMAAGIGAVSALVSGGASAAVSAGPAVAAAAGSSGGSGVGGAGVSPQPNPGSGGGNGAPQPAPSTGGAGMAATALRASSAVLNSARQIPHPGNISGMPTVGMNHNG